MHIGGNAGVGGGLHSTECGILVISVVLWVFHAGFLRIELLFLKFFMSWRIWLSCVVSGNQLEVTANSPQQSVDRYQRSLPGSVSEWDLESSGAATLSLLFKPDMMLLAGAKGLACDGYRYRSVAGNPPPNDCRKWRQNGKTSVRLWTLPFEQLKPVGDGHTLGKYIQLTNFLLWPKCHGKRTFVSVFYLRR